MGLRLLGAPGAHRRAVAAQDAAGGVEVGQAALVCEEGHGRGDVEQHPGRQRQIQPVHDACAAHMRAQHLLMHPLSRMSLGDAGRGHRGPYARTAAEGEGRALCLHSLTRLNLHPGPPHRTSSCTTAMSVTHAGEVARG